MDQKFDGSIGQVAGRDVKTNSAQANVNIHLHGGAESKRYISDKQRRAIGAMIYKLEAKTGVEKLMVYRRLMTQFKFPSMDEMPRELYGRVTAYLDGWIRNGEAEQAAPAAVKQGVHEAAPVKPPSTAQATPVIQRAGVRVDPETPSELGAALLPRLKKEAPWLAVSLAVGATAVAAVALYMAVLRQVPSAQSTSAETAQRCEYGGHRYTIGSIVRQDGVRQKCEATPDNGAEWQPLTSSGRP